MVPSTRARAGIGAVALGAALLVPGAAMAQDASPAASAAAAGECNVGVSWNNFEQRRWAATDKPNIEAGVAAGGGVYLPDTDAKLNTAQQNSDVQTLIDQGAGVLIVLAEDNTVIGPAVQAAKDNNIPVVGYDRLIEDPDVLYVTFDNVGVGFAEASAMFEKVPTGNYVLIKGHQGDPNASVFLPLGWDNAGLADKIASGEINVVYESYTDGWKPDIATDNMDAAIQAASDAGTDIDAVLAENDSTAFGVIASLVTNGIAGLPVSGQDGDPANLNYVAQGLQYVDVWKDSNLLGKVGAEAALQLCAGVPIGEVTISDSLWAELEAAGVAPEAGATAADFTTPGLDKLPDTGDENVVKALILKPTPITADNLQKVLDGGWISQEDLCKGVTAEMPGAGVCGVS